MTISFDLDLEFSKVKYEICYISTKSGPITTRRKANISIWTLGLKFDDGFDLDIWIFKVICDLDHLVTKVRCKDLPDSDRGDFSCRRAVDSSSFNMMLRCYFDVIVKFIMFCVSSTPIGPIWLNMWKQFSISKNSCHNCRYLEVTNHNIMLLFWA